MPLITDRTIETLLGPGKCRLHFVDIENLVGNGHLKDFIVRETQEKYLAAIKATREDLFFVAAGLHNIGAVFGGWRQPSTLFKFRKGANGADRALVDVFHEVCQQLTFTNVFLGSADGDLLNIAEESRRRGAKVTIVYGKGKLAQKYQRFSTININQGV